MDDDTDPIILMVFLRYFAQCALPYYKLFIYFIFYSIEYVLSAFPTHNVLWGLH